MVKTKGQVKIQQMAFVLVALMIFFGIASLFYFSIRTANLRGDVEDLRESEAQELVRKLAGTPEFSFTSAGDCAFCIDADKALVLKDRQGYSGFWGLDYIQIEKLYPGFEGECTKGNYPSCGTITVVGKERFGTTVGSFVSLCRWENTGGGYAKCELGKIYVSAEDIE